MRSQILQQAMFGPQRQYELAFLVGQQFLARYGAVDLFAGHSLGGGLASFAAITHDGIATTFNAAGVHPWTVAPYGKTLANAHNIIDAYRVRGEILSTLQNASTTSL